MTVRRDERRRLAGIERALEDSDPELAAALRSWPPAEPPDRSGAALLVCGTGLLLAGWALTAAAVGLVGVACVVVGAELRRRRTTSSGDR